MAAPLTEAAIEQVRQLIGEGALTPGQRLPPEGELADLLGTSRNTVREAVRALVTARVLDVRRGDGTYVTSLRPELLLAGIGAAADLMQDDFTLELLEVRRLLEPAATAMAARRITTETLDELAVVLTSDVCGRNTRGARRPRRGVPPRGHRRSRQRHAGVDPRRRLQPNHPRSGMARRHRTRRHRAHDLTTLRHPRRPPRPQPTGRRGRRAPPRRHHRGMVPRRPRR